MKQVSSVNEVKNHNVLLVKNTLRSMENGTKNSVARLTGLSIATCNTILNELEQSHEIIPVEASVSTTVGRPPKSYRFNQDYSYICCVYPVKEDGIHYLNYAIIDLGGNIVNHSILYQEKITLHDIELLLDTLIEQQPKIDTIAIGIPGYYYDHTVSSCAVEDLNGIDLVDILEKRYQRNVFVENDMNAIALGFYNSALEHTDFLHSFVTISFFKNNGPGSGIILKGGILHGCNNFAGEILYLPYSGGEIHEMLERSREDVIQCAAFALICYCSILNPETVVFTGENITSDMIPEIIKQASGHIPSTHLPTVRYEYNYRESYVRGLAELALKKIFS
ncbi:MAG: ROK family protein [Lachnospiraceae bacterium]|nr:ROK family protein [Lachnospiraceae bacterium]